MKRVLVVSCQRIGATTGSGVAAVQVASEFVKSGWEATILYGTDGADELDIWAREAGVALRRAAFEGMDQPDFSFPVVGMSNEMPYPSLAYAQLSSDQLNEYFETWEQLIAEAIDEVRPSLIHVHHVWVVAALAKRLARDCPVVASFHGTELHRVEDCPEIFARIRDDVSHIDAFTALSEAMAEHVPTVYGIPRERILPLGNGFDASVFYPNPALTSVTQRFDLPPERPVVVFAGKFARWKGLEHLIPAFARLRDRTNKPYLAIAGTGPDTEIEYYRSLLREYRLTDDSKMLGHLNPCEMAWLFSTGRVFVMPSFREPFGLVLLEALACGARAVTPNQGGPTEFVPSALVKSKDVLFVEGLPSLAASTAERTSFQERLAVGIERQLARDQTVEDRQRIAKAVESMSWAGYTRRLLDALAPLIHERH